MTITSITSLSQLTSTTVASYGTFGVEAYGTSGEGLKAALVDPTNNTNFTDAQATDFVSRYELLNQLPNVPYNGFSATVFEDKTTGKHIIAIRGTEMNGLGQVLIDGLVTDGLSIGGNGFANNQAVEMYRYYQEPDNGPVAKLCNDSEQEKWQLFCREELADCPDGGDDASAGPRPCLNFTTSFKAQLALDVGAVLPPGSSGPSVLSPTEEITVTGHSLGATY